LDSHSGLQTAERLRDRGLKATRPRVLVYETLHAAGGHRSVDDIVALLMARGQALPRMTVYNVVSDLTLAGLILCADTGPGRALYEANNVWHHHYVCRSCGRVHDVPCVEGRKPCLEPPAGVPGGVDEAQVIFRGLCHDCSGKGRD
jgi:Fur family ferric uptake transcriptional regulator